MVDAILKWLGPWLLRRLTQILDPEAAARAGKLLARSNELDLSEQALDTKEKAFQDRLVESDKIFRELEAKNVELDNQILALKNKFAADSATRKGLEDDLQKKLADIDASPDSNRIGQPLPGTGEDGPDSPKVL